MTQPLLGSFLDSPAAVIAQLLIDLTLATDPSSSGAWPVSVDSELDSPDNVLCVTNTEAVQSGRVQISGQMSELWGFQLKIRAADPQVAFAKANAMAVAFDQVIYHNGVTIGSNKYFVGAVTRKGSTLFAGREGSATKRSIYTINAIVDILQTA